MSNQSAQKRPGEEELGEIRSWVDNGSMLSNASAGLVLAEVDALRETCTRLNRRAQQCEAAIADLRKCHAVLESGKAWCGGSLGRAFLAHEVSRLKADLLAAKHQCEVYRGAMAADDERLQAAAIRVGVIAGCDAPDEMADLIEQLRDEAESLRESVAEARAQRDAARSEACEQVQGEMAALRRDNAAMRAALQPFANAFARSGDASAGTSDPLFQQFLDGNTILPKGLTMGDLRRAWLAAGDTQPLEAAEMPA